MHHACFSACCSCSTLCDIALLVTQCHIAAMRVLRSARFGVCCTIWRLQIAYHSSFVPPCTTVQLQGLALALLTVAVAAVAAVAEAKQHHYRTCTMTSHHNTTTAAAAMTWQLWLHTQPPPLPPSYTAAVAAAVAVERGSLFSHQLYRTQLFLLSSRSYHTATATATGHQAVDTPATATHCSQP